MLSIKRGPADLGKKHANSCTNVTTAKAVSMGHLPATSHAPSNCTLTLAPTPVKTDVLEDMLQTYPNKNIAIFLIDGFKNGFNLQCTKPPVRLHEPANLKSVLLQPECAQQKVNKEVAAGRFGGPWDTPPIPNLVISPIGLREKKVKGTGGKTKTGPLSLRCSV